MVINVLLSSLRNFSYEKKISAELNSMLREVVDLPPSQVPYIMMGL